MLARLEAAPRNKQIGYYSDMYKLEFALPKFAMYKRLLAKVLAEQFVLERGWSETQAVEFGRQTLRGNVEEVFRFAENPASLNQAPGTASVSLQLQRFVDVSVRTGNLPIASLKLMDWQDTDETPDQLLASSIGTISVKGRKASKSAAALPGDLDADVLVSGGIKKIQVAGTLAGDVTAGTGVGSVKAGNITGTITQGAATLLGSNPLSEVLAELSGTFAG
jgi:hypothetical protein